MTESEKYLKSLEESIDNKDIVYIRKFEINKIEVTKYENKI